MPSSQSLGSFPSIIALDADLVLHEEKRGASFQLDETYFTGQLQILQTIQSTPGIETRIQTVQQSYDLYEDINIDFESLSRDSLWSASRQFRQLLQQLPEVVALQSAFPETCVVVPEWLRTKGVINYGARVYFFRDDDAPDPEAILQKNIDAVLSKDRDQFNKYHGQLHGYPDCCIDFFHDRTDELPPEKRSVEPFSETIDDERLGSHSDRSVSIDEVITDFLATESSRGFFAKAFYPEPDCGTAQTKGGEIYNKLNELYPEQLVKDFFRLNFGICHLRAQGVIEDAQDHPQPGILGKEHLYFYLPLKCLLTLSRYN